jgi:hypothetical protein
MYLGHYSDTNPLGFDAAASKLLSHLSRKIGHAKSRCAAVHIGTPQIVCDALMCRHSD